MHNRLWGTPERAWLTMLSFSSNVLFINKLHSKSFLSNFWGAVHFDTASFVR